VYAVGNDCIAW